MRGIPISAADRERDAELRYRHGRGPALLPVVIRAAAVFTVGALVGCIVAKRWS